MKIRKLNRFAMCAAAGLFAGSAYAYNTVTLSALESGATVHALSAKTQHTTVSDADALLAAAQRSDAMIMLAVTSRNDVATARSIIATAMDRHLDVLVDGTDELVAELRPSDRTVWVPGNRVFLSTRNEKLGLFLLPIDRSATVDEINTELSRTRRRIAGYAAQARSPVAQALAPAGASKSTSTTGAFRMPDLSAETPSAVCASIQNQMVNQINDPAVPPEEIRRAVQRVCQYGTIGMFNAVPADTTAYDLTPDPNVLLNIRQEWMVMLSENKAQPEQSRAYMWVRTLGDHAGSGFAFSNGIKGNATTEKKGVNLYDLLDVSIHSGWGPIYATPDKWANGKPMSMFRCESDPSASTDTTSAVGVVGPTARVTCPVKPRLLSVVPENNYDDKVAVATSTSWLVNGDYSPLATPFGPLLNLNLNGSYIDTVTSIAVLDMVHTSTNSGTTMYRTTRWQPNWEAVARWVEAKGLNKYTNVDLSGATPLAVTVNPDWSTVWELPYAGNMGRTTLYTSAYEARSDWCAWIDKDNKCTNSDTAWYAGTWLKNTSFTVTLPKPE